MTDLLAALRDHLDDRLVSTARNDITWHEARRPSYLTGI